jgi:hypothetical protein
VYHDCKSQISSIMIKYLPYIFREKDIIYCVCVRVSKHIHVALLITWDYLLLGQHTSTPFILSRATFFLSKATYRYKC